MGMFSSKKKHFVDTSVVRLVDDNLIPDVTTTALIESLFSEQSLVNAIKNESASGVHRNFEAMFRYAAKETGGYFYGLPDARVIGSSQGNVLAKAQLELDVGAPVTLDYMHFRPLNNTHAAWEYIFENGRYNPITNEIGALSDNVSTPVYLTKIVAVHAYSDLRRPEQSSVGEFGASSSAGPSPLSSVWEDSEALKDLLVNQEVRYALNETEAAELHYAWIETDASGVGQLREGVFVYDLAAYDTDQEYYQARYTTSAGTVGYWTYDPLTGNNAPLNAVFGSNEFTGAGRYFPFAVFRSEGVNRATDALKNTEEYQTTEKLLNYLGIDFREMADSMHADADINKVKQAVLMMGVPINAQSESEIDYLYRYFSDLHDSLPAEGQKIIDYEDTPDRESVFGASAGGAKNTYAVDISDADFRTTLSFGAIEVRLKAGVIGEGDVEIGRLTNTTTNLPPTGALARAADSQLAVANARMFRKQITKNIYQEIKVVNPKMRYHILLERGAEGSAEDGRILIPLEYDVTQSIPSLKRQELYYKSLHFVFNSHEVQTIKWYQRGAFAVLLILIAVVVTMITRGLTIKGLMTAIANATITQATIATFLKKLLLRVVISFASKVVFEEIAEELGPEVAYWLAAIMAVAAVKAGFSDDKMLMNIEADKVLAAAVGLMQGTSNVIGDLFEDLLKDQNNFLLESEKMQKELDEANALLDTDTALSPYTFLNRQPLSLFGEPPAAYFERTIHLGNPGAQAIQISQNFIENSLRLPTFDQTVGDSSNE